MASAADIQAIVSAALAQQSQQIQEQLASRDEVISKLMSKVGLDDDTPQTKSVSPNQRKSQTGRPSHIKKGKASTAQGLGESVLTPIRPNRPSNSRSASGQKKTPTRQQKTPTSQQKRTGTPKTASPTANPLQMVTANMPEAFSSTRDALYVHIKIIWNMIEQKAIPGPPHPSTLAEFNSRFSDPDQIATSVENVGGTPLIPVKDIVTLKSLRLGRRKIGKGVVNLDDFFVDYTQATLARLGLRVWGPDLDDSPHSLYNEACRQAALKSFRQAAAGGAYAYMNVSKKYAKDLELLIPAYNHYVHFLVKNCYEREKKQAGKFREDEDRKVISRARERLRDSRLQFALDQKLQKRYKKIISDVNAHSDDEYNAAKGVYVIKTLKFRSKNANKFFRRLDAAILQSDELNRKRVQRRKRVLPSTPQPSIFPKPPMGLALDFYDAEWFNNLLAQQRITVADSRNVALLPDASQSLLGKKVPSENLTDKQFTDKFFDQLAAPYDLTHEIENEEEEDDSETEDDDSFSGEEIDLDHTSGDDDTDEDEYLDDSEEAMEGIDSAGPSGKQIAEGGEDEEDEEDARERRYNAMVLDEDSVW